MYTDAKMIDAIFYTKLQDLYKLSAIQKSSVERLNYDEFVFFPDFNFMVSVESEYRAFFYVLYRYFGAYSITIKSDPKDDGTMFGNFIAQNYQASAFFSVSSNGDYNMNIKHSFIHDTNDQDLKKAIQNELQLQDMSFTDKILIEDGNINDWIRQEKQTKNPIQMTRRKYKQNE